MTTFKKINRETIKNTLTIGTHILLQAFSVFVFLSLFDGVSQSRLFSEKGNILNVVDANYTVAAGQKGLYLPLEQRRGFTELAFDLEKGPNSNFLEKNEITNLLPFFSKQICVKAYSEQIPKEVDVTFGTKTIKVINGEKNCLIYIPDLGCKDGTKCIFSGSIINRSDLSANMELTVPEESEKQYLDSVIKTQRVVQQGEDLNETKFILLINLEYQHPWLVLLFSFVFSFILSYELTKRISKGVRYYLNPMEI